MTAILNGFFEQFGLLVRERRLRLLIVLFVAASALTLAVFHNKAVRDQPVVVVDADNTRVTRLIRTAIESTPELTVIHERPESVEEAQRWLDEGRVSAVILLPKGLTRDVKLARKGKALIAIDMSNILLGKLTYKALFKTFNTLSIGIQAQFLQKIGEIGDRPIARAAPLTVEDTASYNIYFSYAAYLGPALLFFFLHIFIVVLATHAYLPTLGALPMARRLGREMAVLIVGIALGLFLLYGLLPLEGISPQVPLSTCLQLCAAFCLADLLLVAACQSLMPSAMMAFQLSVLIAMLSMMLAGVTYPADAFPPLLQRASGALPFTPFARGIKLILQEPNAFKGLAACLADLGHQSLCLGAIAACCFSIRALIGRMARRRTASTGSALTQAEDRPC